MATHAARLNALMMIICTHIGFESSSLSQRLTRWIISRCLII